MVGPVYPGLVGFITHAAYDPSDMGNESSPPGHAVFAGVTEIMHASHHNRVRL